ncbi:MAG: phasin family protein [Magnetospirillum sp.]|nr:phasin family protein [Magnetospirillum sp.]
MTTAKAKAPARTRASNTPKAAAAAPVAAPEAVAPVVVAEAAPEPVAPVVVAEAAPEPVAPVVVAEVAPEPVAPVVVAEVAPVPVAAMAKDAIAQIEHAVSAGKDTIEQVVKASKDAAAKGYDKAVALTKEQVGAAVKAQTSAAKAYEETIASAKENLDAVVKAGQVLSQGLQDIGKSVASLAHETVEGGVEASKKLLAVKTLKDAVDVQSTLAKEHLDRMLAHSTELTTQTVKMFETAFAPVQARVTAAIEKLVKHHH